MTVTVRLVITLLLSASVASACRSRGEAEKRELPTLDVTHWTDKTELFMEYPPLVTGKSARFAVHLTKMDDFKALDAGRPSAEFTPERGGTPTIFPGTNPVRPGAFRIEGTPPAAGTYRWAILVDAPGLEDRHDLGTITVFGDEAAANADAERRGGADPAAFAYLKEQQWANEFATAPATQAELRSSVRVPATIEALTGGEAVVAAPAAGRFSADRLLSVGATVRAGQTLGRLEPRLATPEDRAAIAAEVSQAQLALEGARAELARAERLLAERAAPARRVEEARRAVAAAEARLRAVEARLAQRDETLRSGGGAASGNAFALRAPIGGRLAEVKATLGATYDEGAPLFKIVRTDAVELRAHVPAADVGVTRDVSELALEIAGRPDAIVLRPHHMHDAGILDPATRALPVQFEIDNPGGQLLIGQTGTAVLFKRDRVRVLAVPKEAVLMEAGRPFVFVQVGGEKFARRAIEIASRDGDLVGVKSGLRPGDRVVVRGAYDVQLASAAKGLPAEGHVH
ncbi:MAG TPA: efflux RND transporter periplasmic adaptor subunit [Vicinamibacterales bacterium]|nr:efflux RND transporter periplasmic adaptor subunit [Vicinamibacterales bacterium]